MLARASLFAAIDDALAGAHDGQVGVLMVRTQRLRELERMHGYASAEDVCEQMRALVGASIRPVDALFQVAECDFAVVLPGLRNRNHAALAAAKIARILQEPLVVDGRRVMVSSAVGGAVSPGDGTQAELLCRNADHACTAAADTAERFMLHASQGEATPITYADLHDAIANNKLSMVLQPVYALAGKPVPRAEALSRWVHPALGSVSPETFIEVAEQTGLAGDFTRWSLNTALRHASESRAAGSGLLLSVNVQVGALAEPGFVEQLQAMLRFWNVPADSLVVEMTETALMADLAYGERQLRRLRDLGFGVAIDDFGIGYSSMSYLRRLPATELKIDRSFVMDMGSDPRVARLVVSMVELAHHLGLETVAEGVEDASTLAQLRAMGCDYAQGYYLARPEPVEVALGKIGAHPALA